MQEPSANRRHQIEALFHVIVNLRHDEREAYLVATCIGDHMLRVEVERLIAAHDRAGSFMETPAMNEAARQSSGHQAATMVGQFLNQYQILELLGRGGMGEVYRAMDTRLGREVAIKILPSSFALDESLLRRFQQEARAASALNHQNILIVHDIGEANSVHFIATELIRGVTLRTRMDQTPFKISEALQIAIQIADALAAAHDARIIHRDIKPANIMLREDGSVKVLDFGLAKFTEKLIKQEVSTSTSLIPSLSLVNTERGTVMGTFQYSSPEQLKAKDIDERTDVWSLGVVLYEMVAQDAPFKGSSLEEVKVAVLTQEPSPIAGFSLSSDELQRIVAKALAKDREARYQTIKEILFDLRTLQEKVEFENRIGLASGDQELFIGEKYLDYLVKWRTSKQAGFPVFNWPAFFLPIPWLAYRKMFLYFGLFFTGSLAVTAMIASTGIDVSYVLAGVGPGLGFGLGIFANTLYCRHVTKKLRRIKQQKLERHGEMALIKRTGGTSKAMGVMGLVLVLAALFLLPKSVSSIRSRYMQLEREQQAMDVADEGRRLSQQATDLYLKAVELGSEISAIEYPEKEPERTKKYASDQIELLKQSSMIMRQASDRYGQAGALLQEDKKRHFELMAQATLKYAEACDLSRQQAEVLLKIDKQPLETTIAQYRELDSRVVRSTQEFVKLFQEARKLLPDDSTGTEAAPAGSPTGAPGAPR